MDVWHNWFHGGVNPNTLDRTLFIAGMVVSTERAGPMAL
jgi:hypothetical protein